MHWDAMLEDGKGELLFGRPIRWILYTYGGRVVPFTIARTPARADAQVQDVTTGAATYGHRFLTTSGRAGRAIKVRSFDEYRNRLLENFVIIERSERHNRIAARARRQGAAAAGPRQPRRPQRSGLLQEVPDLVEYPSVIAGTFAREFLELPEEVLTTTLIHHQHYFPMEGEDGKLKKAFLAVINIEPDNERTIARNAERVVTARLRDARFFWEADRKVTLESRIERLSTLVFHKKLGQLQRKGAADREARALDREGRVRRHRRGGGPRRAWRRGWRRPISRRTWSASFRNCRASWAASTRGRKACPRTSGRRSITTTCRTASRPTRRRRQKQLGKSATAWAAVSLADKFDTLVGLFAAGEKPTGSRDPFGLRRAAQGVDEDPRRSSRRSNGERPESTRWSIRRSRTIRG